jgi:hypothetical protein
LAAPAHAQSPDRAPDNAPLTIAVQASGELPGFRIEAAAPFLADRMGEAGIAGWHFVPHAPGTASPNRIEWTFERLAYAGGEVRRFFPMPESQGAMDVHLQGPHRLISAEAKLYLDGQYQTAVAGQQAVQGGAGDPDLTEFIAGMTRNLENAYRAIDMSPAPRHAAP